MMKKRKINKSFLISSILCLVPVFIAIIFYKKLPEEIPMHFNFKGEVTSHASKIFLIINPMILLNTMTQKRKTYRKISTKF